MQGLIPAVLLEEGAAAEPVSVAVSVPAVAVPAVVTSTLLEVSCAFTTASMNAARMA